MAFTTYEIAYRLDVSEETVRRWIRTGLLKADDATGKYLVQEEDLQQFLKKRGTPAGKAMSWLASMGAAGVRATSPGVAFAASNMVTTAALSGLKLYKVLSGLETVGSDELSGMIDEVDKSMVSLRENLNVLRDQASKIEAQIHELEEIKTKLRDTSTK
nr:helix-turn-helix domain-containing protein [Bacilli bacterium]